MEPNRKEHAGKCETNLSINQTIRRQERAISIRIEFAALKLELPLASFTICKLKPLKY